MKIRVYREDWYCFHPTELKDTTPGYTLDLPDDVVNDIRKGYKEFDELQESILKFITDTGTKIS